MAEVFNFETGLKEYVINGWAVRFNPADPGFVGNFNTMLSHLSKGQDELRETMKKSKGASDIVVEAVNEYCAFGIVEFDTCFGEGACNGIFEGCSLFAPQPDTNLPLWVIFCDYIADIIMNAIEALPDDAKTDGLRVDGARSKALMDKYKVKYQ